MKHFVGIGLLAVSALLGTQERASAWVRFKFCAGVNADFQFHGSDWGICLWRKCPPLPADCGHWQGGWPQHPHHAFLPQQPWYGYGNQPAYANAPEAPAPQPPSAGQPAAALTPMYSNFYGQYYYQPASYYPDDGNHFRIGINFGR